MPRAERPARSGRRHNGRRIYPGSLRVPGMAAMIMIMLAGGVALALSWQHVDGRPSGRSAAPSELIGSGQHGLAAAARGRMAAEWISQQVSRSAIVACDPLMCSTLVARGVPAANLLILQTAAVNLLGAEVVVATPAVRSQYGRRLDSVYAPSVIAGFGSGPGRVDVRVIASRGAAAYLGALRQDVAARKAADTQLLANKRIEVTPQARMQLAAGEVDSRLLIMLPALATTRPIQILAFGDLGPGASPGIPFCSADLSGSGRAAGMTDASYLRLLVAFVRAQLNTYAASTVILRQGDRPVVRVEFSGPSPLGLLAHG